MDQARIEHRCRGPQARELLQSGLGQERVFADEKAPEPLDLARRILPRDLHQAADGVEDGAGAFGGDRDATLGTLEEIEEGAGLFLLFLAPRNLVVGNQEEDLLLAVREDDRVGGARSAEVEVAEGYPEALRRRASLQDLQHVDEREA